VEPASFDRLTPAELQVLRLVARNRTSKAIAQELGRSPHTVDNQIKSALAKTGAADRYSLAIAVAAHEGRDQRLHEARATFGHFPAVDAAPSSTPAEPARRSAGAVLLMIGGGALLVMLLLIASAAMLPAAQTLIDAVGIERG